MSAVLGNRPAPTFGHVARRSEILLRARELGIVIALIAVFAITTVKNHAFAERASVQQLLAGASLIALLTSPQPSPAQPNTKKDTGEPSLSRRRFFALR